MNSRRRFLKNAMFSTAAMGAYATLGTQFSAMKAMASQSRFDDYKALVCVFLYGGNDSFNMLVPTDSADYQAYQQTRQQMAYSLDEIVPLNLSGNDVPGHGMPNAMNELASMFNSGELSLVTNMGPLVEPATKQQLLADPNKLPPFLFSHNSQQALWQTAGTDVQLARGWLGNIADLLQDTNTPLPMNIGVGGSDILSTGSINQPLVLDATGPEDFILLSPDNPSHQRRLNAHQALLSIADSPLQREYANRINNARDNTQIIKQALASTPLRDAIYPQENSLASQLKMVADMIAVQSALNQSRQVFFVGIGGWDTHDNQMVQHQGLLATLSGALHAFSQDLKALQVYNQVTTVTLSEFGRTLTSNRDGTDHGWAGHQLIMGGAANGGKVLGHLPQQMLGTNDDWDDGRMIPTTSIEQFGGQLAQWFGLSESEINFVFPNLGRFDSDAIQLFKAT